MYCRNCGKRVDGEVEYCPECEATLKTEEIKNDDKKVEVVEEVRAETKEEVVENNNPIKEKVEESKEDPNKRSTTNNSNSKTTSVNSKSKLAAGLFGIFLGSFGVHNFYLGFTGKAVAQLLITVLSCGMLSFVSAIWGLIEGILILSGDVQEDANGVPLKE